jgi:hypothetical protein
LKQGKAESIALLAPVPLEHLEDGAEVCAQRGKVAFGSRAFLLFVELDQLRQGQPVDVYLYASHAHEDGSIRVTWTGRYIGYVMGVGGAHPQGEKYRPPSTFKYESDNKGHWAIFWEVTDLRRLPKEDELLVQHMRGWKHKTKYSKFFVPEGPLIIERP